MRVKKEPSKRKHKHCCPHCNLSIVNAETTEDTVDGELLLKTVCLKCLGIVWWRRRLETNEEFLLRTHGQGEEEIKDSSGEGKTAEKDGEKQDSQD